MTIAWFALRVPEGGEGAPASPFTVEFGLIFWTWLVFGTLLFLLWKFAFPRLIKSMEEREQKIARQLAEAEKMNTDARAALESQQKATSEARAFAQTLLVEARAAAEKEHSSVMERVKAEQDALLERARKEIAAEREKAIADLRKHTVDLSLAAAGKLLSTRLDTAQDRQIVEDYLRSVETSH